LRYLAHRGARVAFPGDHGDRSSQQLGPFRVVVADGTTTTGDWLGLAFASTTLGAGGEAGT
jgi:hypothetical protein